MSTPIEIVREYRLWQRRPVMVCGYTWNEPPHTREEYDAALASVLADAERFAALELAQDTSEIEVCWVDLMKDEPIGTLAELADKLRSETK